MRHKKNKNSIVFTGGGTGGHIFPGLAVADELSDLTTVPLYWIGSSSGMDRSIVEKNKNITRFFGVPAGKLRRYFSLQNVLDVFKIFAGFCASFFHLLFLKPAVVFSKGGFVSVPVCFAAALLKIPVYTHECDFSAGLATKLNSLVASHILVSYEETKLFFKPATRKKVIVTGNPVRPVFYEADPLKGRAFLGLDAIVQKGEKPLLLVCGGSLGARQINDLVLECVQDLCEKFIVVHQTGRAFREEQESSDAKKHVTLPEDYYAYDFIYDEMPHVLAAADIVFSRAGANSLWENAVTGKAMVLLPLSGSGTRGDQVENAAFFETQGAALVLDADADKDVLVSTLDTLNNQKKRNALSLTAKNMCSNERPALTIAKHIYGGLV